MAEQTKARVGQLIRTDDIGASIVRFYDRREANAAKAYIGEVDVAKLASIEIVDSGLHGRDTTGPLFRAARHGVTQNILDSSNKLIGDARVAYIRKACETVQAGGWASNPVDETVIRQRAIDALVKMGFTVAAATEVVDRRG